MTLYRLYIDESGDHTYNEIESYERRYLALLGCIIEEKHYINKFYPTLENLKRKHFNSHPDDPVILHRKEIIQNKGRFSILKEPQKREAFDRDLLQFLREMEYVIILIVMDKKAHLEKYRDLAFHPYNFSLAIMLERYFFFLKDCNARGDVMIEGRQKKEDEELKEAYRKIYSEGTKQVKDLEFQRVLTSKEIKIKNKTHNIAGLQICDILAYPLKKCFLIEKGLLEEISKDEFNYKIYKTVEDKFYSKDGKVEGYGKKIFP
uniref:DUF3800 domain-containing protein n=1 Tax=Dictyoglomus thermophilum TaxID=14 RepID=A0A7V3ZID5_DICTH